MAHTYSLQLPSDGSWMSLGTSSLPSPYPLWSHSFIILNPDWPFGFELAGNNWIFTLDFHLPIVPVALGEV